MYAGSQPRKKPSGPVSRATARAAPNMLVPPLPQGHPWWEHADFSMKKDEKGSSVYHIMDHLSGFQDFATVWIHKRLLASKESSVKDTLFANVHIGMCPDIPWQPPKGKGRSCLVEIVEGHLCYRWPSVSNPTRILGCPQMEASLNHQ